MFRPALPKVPAAGCAKALGLNQKFWSTARPSEKLGLATLGSPTRFQGWAVVSPTPAMSSPRQTDNGRPDWKKVTPESCQPPRIFLTRVSCWRPNGSS